MPVNWRTPKATHPTLWHQPELMAQQRLRLRGAGAHRCLCGATATNHWVQTDLWLCQPCSTHYALGHPRFPNPCPNTKGSIT